MDDIPAGDVAKSLQCNHQFHGECILAWWSKQVRRGQDSATSCPLCRCIQPMPAEAEARVVQAAAMGLADVEKGIPYSFDTYCRMYCATKPFIATAMMRLVEEGRANLDDCLSKYIPQFGTPNADEVSNTLRQQAAGGYVADRPDMRNADDDSKDRDE
eukprot:g24225.t1